MTTMEFLQQGDGHWQCKRSLRRGTRYNRSPLGSPPLVASPLEDTPAAYETFETSFNHLITLPRCIDEPLVSFLMRSLFKFPLIFHSIQASVTSLSTDREMDDFIATYGSDEAEVLVFVAFIYAMGEDIRQKYDITAPDQLPHDTTFREAIGLLHLAELFDLDSLRRVARLALEDMFLAELPHSDYAWAFGRGSRITGALCSRPEVPVKIDLVDQFTHLWDRDGSPADEKAFMILAQTNFEFYGLVKSFCLGHVNEDGINDISSKFLPTWLHAVQHKGMRN